jgi:Ser/Thr protein kinase RdoA (MazF antagonist)
MSVKTPFTRDDFAAILSQYDLGAYAKSEAIEQGTVQTNYFLWTTHRRLVFRCYENRSRESVLFESDLLAHLSAHGYPCPARLKSTQGDYVGTYRDKPYMVFQFVDGEHIEHPDAHHKRQLIQIAAELQQLTRGFRSRHTPHRWNYDPDLCRALARAQARRIDTRDACRKLAWLTQELRVLDLPPSLPRGICHCDFHFSNVLFQGDDFISLLDFDDANVTYLQFDLVGLIDHWTWPHTADALDLAEARSIVQDYVRHRPLPPIEQEHLYDVYKLSVLFDCVWCFGRGAADDCRERSKIEALTDLGRQGFFEALFRR